MAEKGPKTLIKLYGTNKKKGTKREVLSLIGKLSFAAKVVPNKLIDSVPGKLTAARF